MITTKIYTNFKYIIIALTLVFSFSSCESDFENAGGQLVDNGAFSTNKEAFEVLAYTKNIESSRVDNLRTGKLQTVKMPLGVYKNDDFGLLTSGLVAQANIPATVDWGENPKLDAVFIEIPYNAINDGVESDGKPKFVIEDVYGDETIPYQVRVSRIDDYLTALDPTDPTKPNKYYSDKIYNTTDVLYPWTDFMPSKEDTVTYYDRTLLDTSVNNYNEIVVGDSIKFIDSKPFISFKLDNTFFKNNFIENSDQTVFDNIDNFYDFFRGIIIESQGTDGSVIMLDLSLANINLYYTNTEDKTEIETDVDKDLDGDGDIDGTSVTYPSRTENKMSFPLQGIRAAHIDRDYANANGSTQILNPNTPPDPDGAKKLYIQGAAGSIAVIDLFKDEDLTALRAKKWLINEASLTFYIDNQNENNLPNRLLLYKLDPDPTNDVNENTQILDAITEGLYFNGFLHKDGDDPTKYKVNITDYISEVLKDENYTELSTLGLKLYNAIDTPITPEDLIVSEYSWLPEGVVLYGNDYTETDADFSKKLKLEIYYTELNN